jgi:hypothetical protein
LTCNFYFIFFLCLAFSTTINDYNICDSSLTSITEASGFISSPNYPTYIQVPDDCTQKIVAPKDKVIRMWVAADMKYSDFNDEYVDFLNRQ